MGQEFFKSTLISKYIKYLLSYTPLPLFPVIEHSQYMIKGCCYIHKDKVLKCTKSGIFSAMLNYFQDTDYLYASDLLDANEKENFMTIINNVTGESKPSKLVVTDKLVTMNNIQLAEYEIINTYNFGEYKVGLTQNYISNTSYYDSETHKYLGDYLRLLRNQYGLDLMSLYNCYNYETINVITLNKTQPYVTDTGIRNKKILMVPIKFNTKYTVALDCRTPIIIKAIIYRDGLVMDELKSDYISNMLNDSTQQINNTNFNKPFIFSINNQEKYIQQFENSLYLAIQVPYNLDSTLVVLEGDFKDYGKRNISDISIINSANPIKITSSLSTTPSLLKQNDKRQHPFSDKLISYLLRNTIDEREYIDDNVANIEKKINYNPQYQGMWDSQLRYILYNKYMDLSDDNIFNKEDILGFVDIDIEEAVRKGYINYAVG